MDKYKLKKKIKENFSNNAKSYDENITVQKEMVERLIENVPKKSYKRILEIGCGTGELTKKLLEEFKDAKITAVDLSKEMIDAAKKKLNSSNINFVVADIESFELTEKYDLIISSATLQWIDNLKDLLLRLKKSLSEEGTIAFSTFLDGTFDELDHCINIALNKNNIDEEINRGYLSLNNLKELEKRLFPICKSSIIFSEKYIDRFKNSLEFMRNLKAVGANNSKIQDLITINIIKDILNIYDEKYKESENVYVTYNTGYFIVGI